MFKIKLSWKIILLLFFIGGLFSPVVSADEERPIIETWKTEFAANIIEEVNQQRVLDGLGALKQNESLQLAAQQKAEDMATRGYFSHTTPDGKTPWYWIEKNEIKYALAGENLAVKFEKPTAVVIGWMNSPSHKKNVLKAAYSETGVGVAKGMYEGQEVIFIAEFYVQPKREFSVGQFLAEYF